MSEDWLDRFRRRGAVQEGHFLLSSGLHSPVYIQSALVLQYPQEAEALGRALADLTRQAWPQAVIGPALGAVIVAHEVARALGVRAVFAERSDGRLALRRGFAIEPGERILIVEDVITTGTTTAEVAALVRRAGGVVAAVAALIDRTGGRKATDAPLHALASLDLPAFAPQDCPLCGSGVPISKPGSRPSGASRRPAGRRPAGRGRSGALPE